MQSTDTILMIKPAAFGFNTETALTNAFQKEIKESGDQVREKVLSEFEGAVQTLRNKKVNVLVFEDTADPVKPDAVFPNNWLSTHDDGTLLLYPMCTPNRRTERRADIVEDLKKQFDISKVIDLSEYENENKFLEGTGSIVFDHAHKKAYACISPRTHKELLLKVCEALDYEPVYFYAHDQDGKEIYHTNVMMCVGQGYAVICLESISDATERKKVETTLRTDGHEPVDINFSQMNRFAGNMLALRSTDNNPLLVLSQSAFESLLSEQKECLQKHTELVPLKIKTIETIGGGSARCMIAEVFFHKKDRI
jgi:hypothetical protein